MRLPSIKGHWRWHGKRDGLEATLVIEGAGRWFRVGAFYGQPPGSHIGLWRTNTGGPNPVHGWNLRIGKRYVRCLTLLSHTRRSRA